MASLGHHHHHHPSPPPSPAPSPSPAAHVVILHLDWHLWIGLGMAGIGALILAAMVIGAAGGLGMMMFNLTSGRARIVRAKRYRRSARHMVRVSYPNGDSSPASYLSKPVLADEDTKDLEAVHDDTG